MSEDSEIALPKLIEEIDQHIPRIKDRAQKALTSGSPAWALSELSGTVLPVVRDLTAYVAMLEAAMVRHAEETAARIEQMEDGLMAAAGIGNGTQFDPEDADKFIEFLKATKLVLETLNENTANPEPVRKQFAQMIVTADELIGIVEDCIIDDEEDGDGDDGEDAEEADSGGRTAVKGAQ